MIEVTYPTYGDSGEYIGSDLVGWFKNIEEAALLNGPVVQIG